MSFSELMSFPSIDHLAALVRSITGQRPARPRRLVLKLADGAVLGLPLLAKL
jgi:hypothetical protein